MFGNAKSLIASRQTAVCHSSLAARSLMGSLILSVICLFFSSTASALNCKGMVQDADVTPNPLHSVFIDVVSGAKDTYSDQNGQFTIKIPDTSQCSSIKVVAKAATLNGQEYSSDTFSLVDGGTAKISIKNYLSCKYDLTANTWQTILHAPWDKAPRLPGRKHTAHILQRNSPHRNEGRYRAEVKCLQKSLDVFGFKSGNVSSTFRYKPSTTSSVTNFIMPPTTNSAGIYGLDEALAVWLYQAIAICKSNLGKLHLVPKRCGGKKILHKKVGKTTLLSLNKAQKGGQWSWQKFKPEAGYTKRAPSAHLMSNHTEALWGSKVLLDVLSTAGKTPNVAAKGGLQIEDISYPTAGVIAGHKSHESGVDVDIHTIKTTGEFGPYDYWDAHYDRDYSEALLQALANHPNVENLFFHDPEFLPGGGRRNNITPMAARAKISCARRARPTDKDFHPTRPCHLLSNSHTHHIHMRIKFTH